MGDEGNKNYLTLGASSLYGGFVQVRKWHSICQMQSTARAEWELDFCPLSPPCAGCDAT